MIHRMISDLLSFQSQGLVLLSLVIFSSTISAENTNKSSTQKKLTPYEIVDQAPETDWRDIDLDNALYITLKSGTVIVELAPQFAPNHVENTKKLVRSGVFNDTSFYRVIDGFVAQGGPADPEKVKPPSQGQLSIADEFTINGQQSFNFTQLNAHDGYADEVGYVGGFAVGRNQQHNKHWLLHCYGAFAMGRANETDSGGTELYAVIGNAQRYLDRNTTVFGKVVVGMEHLQALKRSSNLSGPIDVSQDNKIVRIEVGRDRKKLTNTIKIMKTDSASFKALIESRKNRHGPWFVHQHDYIDVCSVPVPVRQIKKP